MNIYENLILDCTLFIVVCILLKLDSDMHISISLFVGQCFAIVRLKKMQTLKIIIKWYKLITFRDMRKNLNLKFVMIPSFAVALTDNEFYLQLIKESSHFVLKASRKTFFII